MMKGDYFFPIIYSVLSTPCDLTVNINMLGVLHLVKGIEAKNGKVSRTCNLLFPSKIATKIPPFGWNCFVLNDSV